MAGMTVGALVTGNSVIVKPSQQTSIIAHEFLMLLNQSVKEITGDQIKGLVNFLPGDGKTIGSYLVAHPKTKLIAFTGSSAVGMSIHNIASQARPVKRVITEMGGKNAIIIDESADLDEAIPGVIHSSFGYAGQKCSASSRVIIHENIYEQFIARLIEAAKVINIGDPRNEACTLPPVIDVNAQHKISQYIELGKQDGTMLLGDLVTPESGYYLSPYIFTDLEPGHKLVQEEIFGPVLVVFKAHDLNHAIELANDTPYGLTGAFYSRSPLSIEKVSQEFQVGNLYINRGSTGAIVSRQAFGGLKQSSIGFKSGGPNYLLQFVQEKTITENTMRRGFVGD
jgi:RHH-type proline utilization regulon transcriptional repressor/proline dehydrogenase/delta 1-pyrroline-5-carboxylate dehydrogenase